MSTQHFFDSGVEGIDIRQKLVKVIESKVMIKSFKESLYLTCRLEDLNEKVLFLKANYTVKVI